MVFSYQSISIDDFLGHIFVIIDRSLIDDIYRYQLAVIDRYRLIDRFSDDQFPSIGYAGSDKQPRDVRRHCINSFKAFFCILLDEAIFLPGQLIHC